MPYNILYICTNKKKEMCHPIYIFYCILLLIDNFLTKGACPTHTFQLQKVAPSRNGTPLFSVHLFQLLGNRKIQNEQTHDSHKRIQTHTTALESREITSAISLSREALEVALFRMYQPVTRNARFRAHLTRNPILKIISI